MQAPQTKMQTRASRTQTLTTTPKLQTQARDSGSWGKRKHEATERAKGRQGMAAEAERCCECFDRAGAKRIVVANGVLQIGSCLRRRCKPSLPFPPLPSTCRPLSAFPGLAFTNTIAMPVWRSCKCDIVVADFLSLL
jgi:hypothetical protein